MKKKASWILGMLSACAVGVGVAVCASISKSVSVKAETLFTWDNSVTVTKNVQATGEGLADERYGTKLSSSTSGAKVNLAEDACGVFELDFRAYTATAYNAGEQLCYGDTVNNPVYTLKTMSLLFTDASNAENSFRIGIDGASSMNFATPQAYVELDGKKVGKYTLVKYDGKGNLLKTEYNTTGANAHDKYTALYGTSFSNKAYLSGNTDDKAVVGGEVSATVVGFDAFTGEVYAKAGTNTYTIWNVYQTMMDGQTATELSILERYDVSLEFTDVASDATADIVLYSINGQALSGESYTDSVGPRTFAKLETNAVAGKRYALPAPITYDVMGAEVAEIEVEVLLDNSKISVYNAAGQIVETYQAGCYFLPEKQGDIVIEYTAKEASSAGEPFSVALQCYSVMPSVNYSLEGRLDAGEVGTGKLVHLPTATAESDLFLGTAKVTASVYKNGAVMDGYASKALPFDVVFDEAAEYRVDYEALTAPKQSYYYSVKSDVLTFNLDGEFPMSVQKEQVVAMPTASMSLGNVQLSTSMYLYAPNGAVYRIGTEGLSFSQAGKYTVEYRGENGDNVYAKKFDFIVAESLPTFSTAKLTENAPNNRYAAIRGLELDNSADYTGVAKYSEVLDLSKATKNDVLLKAYSSVEWGKDGKNVPLIKLTDIYNSKNYITLDMRFGWHDYQCYGFGYAPNQQPVSIWNGNLHYENDGTAWGGRIDWSTQKTLQSEISYERQCLDLRYDAEEKAFYIGTTTEPRVYVDFDDTSYQTLPWEGFTTGEVYLTIERFDCITVTEVYGKDFTNSSVLDTKVPDIYIDTQGYEDGAFPRAVVGKEYSVFTAEAYDVWSGKPSVDVRVYYNYGTDVYTEVQIKNGAFVPPFSGKYTIVYTAKDAFENVATRLIEVEAVHGADVTGLDFVLESEPLTEATAGTVYEIPQIGTITGGSGRYVWDIKVFDRDDREVSIENNAFIPNSVGTYQLKYDVRDYIGNGAPNEKVYTVAIAVTANATPILYDVVLPKAVLAGAEMILPSISAIDFDGNGNAITPSGTITVTLDGNVIASGADLRVIKAPSITESEKTMTVTYSVENERGQTKKEYPITVVKPAEETGFMAKYFNVVSGNVTVAADSKGILLDTKTSNGAVQFINPVLASEFYLSMSVPNPQKNNVDKVSFILRDYKDMSVSLRLDIYRNTDETTDTSKSFISVNGGEQKKLTGNFYSVDASLAFTYSNGQMALVDSEGQVLEYISKAENGKAFTGFASGKVWVELQIGEVTGDGLSLRIEKLNGQPFSDIEYDYIEPEMSVNGYIALQMQIGENIIPSVTVQDVLAASADAKVSVYKMGSGPILDGLDASVENKLNFSEPGLYEIEYMLTDSSGGMRRMSYSVQVLETEKPVLTVGEVPESASCGSVVALPKATATDNVTKDPTIVMIVIDANGKTVDLDSNGTFTATVVGRYIVRYWCYDEYYNYDMQEFYIYVQ